MDLIPIKPDENLESFLGSVSRFPFSFVRVNNPGDHKCRLLTFDDLELEKGSFLQVYTRPGSDTTAISFDTSDLYKIMYWGLPEPIWHVLHSSIEIIKRGDSYSIGFDCPEP